MHQQLWGYKVEEKLYLGVREQKRLNTTGLGYQSLGIPFATRVQFKARNTKPKKL
jgi:hypothetical protein